MLNFLNGEPFATGSIECQVKPYMQEDNNRIFIPVSILNQTILAVLDTGGIFLILDPEIAAITEIDQFESIGHREIWVRGIKFKGSLFKADLEIDATKGNGLRQEVTVFVPDCTIDEWDNRPTYLGLTGCMENIRFAFDPESEVFYFSSLGE